MKKLIKRIKNFIDGREHKVILFFTLGIVLLMLTIQFMLDGGLKKAFWLSLIPNVIIDMFGILITSYVIAYLFQRSQEKRAKDRVYKMLGNRYEKMVMNLAKDYITFLTKNPSEITNNIFNIDDIRSQVRNINLNVEKYIKDDFLKAEINLIVVDTTIQSGNVFDNVKETKWSVQNYTYFFKHKHLKELDFFISKYISVLPDDLREILFRVEEILQSGIFTTPKEYDIELDTSHAVFNPKEFSKVFNDLGKDIYLLLTFFQEMQLEESPKKSKGEMIHLFTAEKLILSLLWLMLIYIMIDLVIGVR